MNDQNELIITNALVVDFFTEPVTILPHAHIVIRGETIMSIDQKPIRSSWLTIPEVDAGGGVVLPGFFNMHMHFYSTFARGMALRREPPENFPQILERLWWRLDKNLLEPDITYSTLPMLAEAIKSGATTIFDHHASPSVIPGSLDLIAKAVAQAGIRACLCYEVSDRDGAAAARQGIEENVRFITQCQDQDHSYLQGLFGLHASFTISDETLRTCAERAGALSCGFHIHAAEDLHDQNHTMAQSRLRVIQRLHQFGILGANSIAAHCVHVDDSEIALLKETQTFVAHNPESNLNNAVGIAAITDFVQNGLAVGLGTDGCGTRMCNSMRLLPNLQRLRLHDPRAMQGKEVLDIIFRHPARFASRIFGLPLGTITPGAGADLVILDYRPPTPMNQDNIMGHLLFGMIDAPVRSTIARGKLLYNNEGRLTTLDEATIAVEATNRARRLWERMV